MTKCIAVIPARGGSKRIPKKNIREFLGRPSISYPIQTAIESGLFDEIIVSTDAPEIADISLKFGATSVIQRPQQLADDITPTVPVIAHAIEDLNIESEVVVCCIYPVNPFVMKEDLKAGLSTLLENPTTSYVNSICTYPYPIQRALRMDNLGIIEMVNPELAVTRSQDLEEMFHDAGQWYFGKAATWQRRDHLLFNSIGYRIPRWRSQDIDTLEDWELAEKLYKTSFR
jgi:pseudaminic acid cytidylyltransferase